MTSQAAVCKKMCKFAGSVGSVGKKKSHLQDIFVLISGSIIENQIL